MKIILEIDIAGLGEEGAIVDVAPGYARNYLFPLKKAVQHNAQNMSILHSRMKSIERRREERRATHMSIKERLNNEHLSIMMKAGHTGHLYGAVTAQIISEELAKRGITIPKSHIILPDGHTIKNIGVYTVIAKLYHDVESSFQLSVTDMEGNTSIQTDKNRTFKASKTVPEQEQVDQSISMQNSMNIESNNTDI